MGPRYQYSPLSKFLGGVYDELIRASLDAKGLQTDYLVQMSEHHSPIPVAEFIKPLDINTFKVDFYFKQIIPKYSLLEKLRIKLGREAKLPGGVYLILAAQNEASATFSITLNTEGNQPLIEPGIDGSINYYVVTKIG